MIGLQDQDLLAVHLSWQYASPGPRSLQDASTLAAYVRPTKAHKNVAVTGHGRDGNR